MLYCNIVETLESFRKETSKINSSHRYFTNHYKQIAVDMKSYNASFGTNIPKECIEAQQNYKCVYYMSAKEVMHLN